MKKIKELLLQDDNIVKVLEHFQYANIVDRGDEVRCGFDEHTNPSSIRIKKNESISALDFARNVQGDIISLIMENRELKFSQVIRGIKEVLNITGDIELSKKNNDDTFLELFKRVGKMRKKENTVCDNITYEENILDNYSREWNLRFLKDGITTEVQKEFNIGFDFESQRITIPWRNYSGEIIGVMGRSNLPVSENKYLPIINFKKSQALYGFSENYAYLQNNYIFIGEAEKFVLQLKSMGVNEAVALGCNIINDSQIEELLTVNPKGIILCLDKGLEDKNIMSNLDRIKRHLAFRNTNLYFMKDTKGYLNEKESPSDKGLEIWNKLKKDCTFKVKR